MSASHMDLKAARSKDKLGKLPIHLYFEAGDPTKNIRELEQLIAFNPKGLSEKDVLGKIPLHYALQHHASLDEVQLLLAAELATTSVKDNDGLGILQWALKCGCPVNIIDLLMESCPEQSDELPAVAALLQYAFKSYVGKDILDVLVSRNPKVLLEQDSSGDLPIHTSYRRRCHKEFCAELLRRDRKVAETKSSSGKLPLHYAVEARCDLPLIDELLSLYPEGASIPDSRGNLPIHYALDPEPSVEFLKHWSTSCFASDSNITYDQSNQVIVYNRSASSENDQLLSMSAPATAYIGLPGALFSVALRIENVEPTSIQAIGICSGHPRNRAGHPVTLGTGTGARLYYCSRLMKTPVLPGSSGSGSESVCGPSGKQCADCEGLSLDCPPGTPPLQAAAGGGTGTVSKTESLGVLFGATLNSWGLINSTGNNQGSSFFSYGGKVLSSAPRQLQTGDIIQIVGDIDRGYFTIQVDDESQSRTGFQYSFSDHQPSPRGPLQSFSLGVTMAGPASIHIVDANYLSAKKISIASAFDADGVAQIGLKTQISKKLLEAFPAGPSVRNAKGMLPIHIASVCGNFDILKLLLNAHPEGISAVDDDGELPLHKAMQHHSEEVVVESEHPYADGTDTYFVVERSDASSFVVTFDEMSSTEANYDYVVIYKDDTHSDYWGDGKYTGRAGNSDKNFAGVAGRPPLEIPANRFVVYFHSDGSNNDWGFRLTAKAVKLHTSGDNDSKSAITSMLLTMYPDGAKTPNKANDLPLHSLLKKRIFEADLVNMVLTHNPLAVNEKGEGGKLPFKIALENGADPLLLKKLFPTEQSLLTESDSDGRTLLHEVCLLGLTEAAHALLKVFPAGAAVKGPGEKLPIHCILEGASPDSELLPELIAALIDAFPEGLAEADVDSRLPLHYAAMYKLPATIIRALLTRHPEATSMKDSAGRIPLHHICDVQGHSLPKEWVKLSAAGDIKGGGTGREYLSNLLLQGTEEWNKWLDPSPTGKSWVQADLVVPGGVRISEYGLCSANDCPHRDPLSWTLKGRLCSSKEWITLHEYNGEAFNSRWQWMWFHIDSPQIVTSVRLEINSVRSAGDCIQLGHFHLRRALAVEEETEAGNHHLWDRIQMLIGNGHENAVERDAGSETPLQILFRSKADTELIKMFTTQYPTVLLDRGADGKFPFVRAIEIGAHLDVVSAMVPVEDPNHEFEIDKSVLMAAILSPCTASVLEYLLEKYPGYLEEYDEEGSPLLHAAIDKGASYDKVFLLLNARPQAVSLKDKEGNYALAVALKNRPGLRVYESPHPYLDNSDFYTTVSIPGAVSYFITFDEQCAMEQGYDFLTFYKDDNHSEYWGTQKYTGRRDSEDKNYAGTGGRPALEIPASSFVFYFHSDGSNNDWGYKFYVYSKKANPKEKGHTREQLKEERDSIEGKEEDEEDSASPEEKEYRRLLKELYTAYPNVIKDAEERLSLYKLITEEADELFIRGLIAENPELASLADVNSKRLPLHAACSKKPQSLPLIASLLSSYPEGAKARDEDANIPLHLACANGAPEPVINALLEAFPGSADEKRNDDKLPLHLAIMGGMSCSKALRRLLDAYPSAASVCVDANTQKLSLHSVFDEKSAVPEDFILKLIEAYPQAVSTKDAIEQTPLILAIQRNASADTIVAMISACAEGAAVTKGNLLPFHAMLMAKGCNPSLVSAMIAAYPDSVKYKDPSDGKVALHHACSSPMASIEIVNLLLASYPESATEKDNAELLPINYAISLRGGVTVIESKHPYDDNTDEFQIVEVAGAVGYKITFDAESSTESGYDYICFYKDESHNDYWGDSKYSGGRGGTDKSFPGVNGSHALEIPAKRFVIYFHSDGSNNDWGYKMKIETIKGGATDSGVSDTDKALDGIIRLLLPLVQGKQVAPAINFMGTGMPADLLVNFLKTAEDLDSSDANGRNILHAACSQGLAAPVVACLLELAPSLVRVKDNEGQLALHLAIANQAEPEVLGLLLKAYPESALIRGKNGLSPLCDVIQQRASYPTIDVIIQASEDAGTLTNESGSTDERPIFEAISSSAPAKVLENLLAAKPHCATERNRGGKLPLHAALLSNAPATFKRALMAAYADAARQADVRGNLPLHDLVSTAIDRHFVECVHPYVAHQKGEGGDTLAYICLGAVQSYTITFDERSDLAAASVVFYKDEQRKEVVACAENSRWPGVQDNSSLTIDLPSFYVGIVPTPPGKVEVYSEDTAFRIGDSDSSYKITIQRATYHTLDVTAILQQMVDSNGGCVLSLEGYGGFYNQLFTDPAMYVAKTLTIIWTSEDPAVQDTVNVQQSADCWGYRMTIHCSRSIAPNKDKLVKDADMLLTAYPEAASQRNIEGKTPLLIAIEGKAPVEVILKLLSYDPRCASEADPYTGFLPLYYAIAYEYNTEVVLSMLEAYPEAAKVIGEGGHLPLHSIAAKGAFYDVSLLKKLLEIFPEGAAQADSSGQVPIHDALQSNAPEEFIYALLECNPSVANSRDSDGRLPIHYACGRDPPSVSLVDALLKAYPDSAHEVDAQGQLPLHCLVANEGSPESEERLNVCKVLLEHFKEAASKPDAKGLLPLHKALSSMSPNFKIVELVLNAYPDAAAIKFHDPNAELVKEPQKCINEHEMRWQQGALCQPDNCSFPSCSACSEYPDGINGGFYFYCEQCSAVYCGKCRGIDVASPAQHTGALPVHVCISTDAPVELLESMLSAYPEAATKRYIRNAGTSEAVDLLPIHSALETADGNISVDFINSLIAGYPKCSSVRDTRGITPLQLALTHRKDISVVTGLLSANAEGASVANKEGQLPLHLSLIGEAPPLDCFPVLLSAYPSGASVCDTQRKLPLHYAAQCRTIAPQLVADLISAYPDGCKTVDCLGKTPLHYAVGSSAATITLESAHPYDDNVDDTKVVEVPGAVSYSIEFDERSATEMTCDYIVFYKDDTKTSYWGVERYTGPEGALNNNYPGIGSRPRLTIPASRFLCHFHSDGSRTDWGYKITITAHGIVNEEETQRVSSVVENMLTVYPEACSIRSEEGELPILLALESSAPLPVFQLLLKAYPKCADVMLQNEKSLLTLALERSLSVDFIAPIVAACPHALRKKDPEGRLPLHLAIYKECGIETINCIINEYPEASGMHDRQGRTPYLAALMLEKSDDIMLALLSKYPQGASIKESKTGKLPLHYALRSSSTEVINGLIASHPACAREKGEHGQLPLHTAVSKGFPAAVVKQLVDAYPDGVRQPDKMGMIPLHYALNQKVSGAIILESVHPYLDNTDESTVIEVARAHSYTVTFDEMTATESGCDFVSFYKDETKSECWGERYSGTDKSFPGMAGKPPFEIPSNRFVFGFHSDGSANNWGYRVYITANRGTLTDEEVAKDRKEVIACLLDAYPQSAAMKKNGCLPLHSALESQDSPDVLLLLLAANPQAACERNKDGLIPLHYALERKYPTDLVYRCLLPVMPFDLDGKEVFDWMKEYWWTHILSSTADQFVDAVDNILSEYVHHIQLLASCSDKDGRKAVDIATPLCKRRILSHIYFFGRYELKAGPSEHQSATCIVRLATDHDDPHNGMVALKFMRNRDQFDRELNTRKRYDLDGKYVLGALHSHDGDIDQRYRSETVRKGYGDYPYCLVLPSADRNLSSMLIHERIAGREWDMIRSICSQIARALGHMHAKGLIHGDVKPLNIMRKGSQFILIDLDATVSFKNGDFMGAKYSSAYLPPEMIYIDPIDPAAPPQIKTYPTDPVTGMPIEDENRPYELLKAHISQDMWAFGMTFFHMCAGVPFFRANDEDNIDEKQLRQLASWTDEFKNERLNEVKDRHARNLLKKLLNKDPTHRPISIAQVQAHPFLSGSKPVRMEGEEAEYDAFLSYRVASDAKHVEAMYKKLTEAGLKIWWDKACLLPGVDWEQGFCDGLAKSRNFVCFLSRDGMKHREKDFNNYEKLHKESDVDNVLLEQRMALELRNIGLIEKIFPVMIGDVKSDGSYTNYFTSGCHPQPPDVVVDSIEKTLASHFNRLELELSHEASEGLSAAATLKQLMKNQGGFVEGDLQVSYTALTNTIVTMCRNKTLPSINYADPSQAAMAEEMINRLRQYEAILLDRDRRIEALERQLSEERLKLHNQDQHQGGNATVDVMRKNKSEGSSANAEAESHTVVHSASVGGIVGSSTVPPPSSHDRVSPRGVQSTRGSGNGINSSSHEDGSVGGSEKHPVMALLRRLSSGGAAGIVGRSGATVVPVDSDAPADELLDQNIH